MPFFKAPALYPFLLFLTSYFMSFFLLAHSWHSSSTSYCTFEKMIKPIQWLPPAANRRRAHRRGGVALPANSGDGWMRGWALREAGITARPNVASGRPEVDGSDDGGISSGGRSSGACRVGVVVCKRPVQSMRVALQRAANTSDARPDQKVTGATPTLSSGGDECRP